MKLISLSLAVVFVLLGSSASASDNVLLLNYENAFEHGYWVRCGVKDKKTDSRTDPTKRVEDSEPVRVMFGLGLVHGGRLHNGRFAVNTKDLKVIKRASLVIRDGEDVLLKVPLRLGINPGNRVHLSAVFTAQKESVSKMQIVFEQYGGERGWTKERTVAIGLEKFINKPSTLQSVPQKRK